MQTWWRDFSSLCPSAGSSGSWLWSLQAGNFGGRSHFTAQADAGDDRQPGDGAAVREVVLVNAPFLVAAVVGVLHVDVRGQRPPLRVPLLLQAQVQLVERGV